MGKAGRPPKRSSTVSTRSSYTTTRKDPLLPTHNAETKQGGKCGACGRLILLLLPILGCSLIIGSLMLLVHHNEVAITDVTISRCIADYDPKIEVLVMIISGGSIMFVVTKMRNIQINVYHRRQKSESKCMSALNMIAAICNCIAYAGFITLALNDVDGKSEAMHMIGAYLYFILSGIYGLLHSFLLWKQVQYPLLCKIIFTIVPLATITCTIIFCIDTQAHYAFEWFSVAMAALNCGLFSILFMVDNVDDELRDFFCCRRAGGRRGSTSSTTTRSSMTKQARLT